MRALLQVLLGAVLCVAIALGVVYSPIPLIWEHEDQPLVYSITWRSAIVFLLLVLITQGISYVVFRLIGRNRRKPHTKTTDL